MSELHVDLFGDPLQTRYFTVRIKIVLTVKIHNSQYAKFKCTLPIKEKC